MAAPRYTPGTVPRAVTSAALAGGVAPDSGDKVYPEVSSHIEDLRRGALDAFAKYGTSGKALYDASLATAARQRDAAVSGALAEATRRGVPQEMLDSIKSTVSEPYQAISLGLGARSAAAQGYSKERSSAIDTYFRQTAAAVPQMQEYAGMAANTARAKQQATMSDAELKTYLTGAAQNYRQTLADKINGMEASSNPDEIAQAKQYRDALNKQDDFAIARNIGRQMGYNENRVAGVLGPQAQSAYESAQARLGPGQRDIIISRRTGYSPEELGQFRSTRIYGTGQKVYNDAVSNGWTLNQFRQTLNAPNSPLSKPQYRRTRELLIAEAKLGGELPSTDFVLSPQGT